MKTLTAIFNPLPLIEARKAMGLTSPKLAKRVGCVQSMISEIESGKKKPSAPTLAKLCRILDVDMDTLFFFEENNDNTDIMLDKYR